MIFSVSVGGSFGDKPNSPQLFSVTSDGITDITSQRGIDARGGRGRNALFLDLGESPDLDVIFTNALILDPEEPPQFSRGGVVAVAEIDYDNDGDFDLFVARTNASSLKWVRQPHFDDCVLENRNSKYIDVSESAKIPKGLGTRGVTVADFSNEGYVDVFVSRYAESNFLLLNKRDRIFQAIPHSITRPPSVHGDNAQAPDLNADGYIDLVVSHGNQHEIEFGGYYKVYLRTTPKNTIFGFIEVCVGLSPRGRSAMRTLMKTKKFGLTIVHRVGEVGVAVSRSYLECVHFGLALASKADGEVRWIGGEVAQKIAKSGGIVKIGSFGLIFFPLQHVQNNLLSRLLTE